MSNPYKRVVLKISGESFAGEGALGIHPDELMLIADEIASARERGTDIAVVVGGGNIIRGARLSELTSFDQSASDYMGMLGTVINALAMQDALEQHGVYVRVMSALEIEAVCENYLRRRAIRHLEKGRIVIFAAGTGNPFFTTDSAASLRSIEIGADLMIKATKVDGVYNDDPVTNPQAEKYDHLTYDEVIDRKLGVMDLTAICLCRDHGMPLRVFNMNKQGALLGLMLGGNEGTLVVADKEGEE